MPARSQRPIIDRLLASDPLKIEQRLYVSLGDALADVGEVLSPEHLAVALEAHTGARVSVSTLARWRKEIADERRR